MSGRATLWAATEAVLDVVAWDDPPGAGLPESVDPPQAARVSADTAKIPLHPMVVASLIKTPFHSLGSLYSTVFRRLRALDVIAAVSIAVGVVLRARWVLSSAVHPVDDTLFYYQHAVELLDGRGYLNPVTGHPTAFIPPGYSALLAGLFRITGPSLVAGAFLNVALAALGMVFAYLIGRAYFGLWASRLAVLILALFPSQIAYTPALHADILVQTLALGVIWAGLVSRRPVVTGVLLGCLALTAPKELVLLPALVICWRRQLPWRATFRLWALPMAVTCFVVVLPWTVRNAIELHAFVPTATNAGENLWIGNNRDAYGGWMAWNGAGRTGSWAYPTNEVADDMHYRDEALVYAVTHPVRTVQLWPAKLRYTLLTDWEYVGHFVIGVREKPMYGEDADNFMYQANTIYSAVLIDALVMGIVLVVRRDAATDLTIILLALLLPMLISFGMDRYHVTLIPVLAMLAAGIVRERGGLRPRNISAGTEGALTSSRGNPSI
jgi:4-amino-4-deoxy-L-arabinose transferase-like glycosyltransferase